MKVLNPGLRMHNSSEPEIIDTTLQQSIDMTTYCIFYHNTEIHHSVPGNYIYNIISYVNPANLIYLYRYIWNV